jgi:hypothetical protein
MFDSQLPHALVRGTNADQRPNVQRAGEDVIEQSGESVGQLLVEKEAHQ